MICDCSANYGKECLFPEEYNTIGCTSGDAPRKEEMMQALEDSWCNCGMDHPEPKYHSRNCIYRLNWETFRGSVHMTVEEVGIAELVTGWTAPAMKQYDIDALDRIMMQRTEQEYYYKEGKY